MTKTRTVQLAVLLLSLAGYIWIGYFTVRTNFIQLITIYFLLFGLYIFAVYAKIFENRVKVAIGAALLFRLSLLFMTPNLTDDYFRFIWDGLFVAHGFNPYLVMPSTFIHASQTVPGISLSLFSQLNSPNYYTVYPPVCQFIFGFAARLFGGNILGNIITTRIFILLAEFGTIALLYRLAQKFRKTTGLVLLYALNPLTIIELTGNLHFDATMIFFLLLAVYLLANEHQTYSALSFAAAVGTKLVPLLFLPLLIKRLGWNRSLRYFGIVFATLVILFSPFLSVHSVSNFLSSVSLYFRVFEFNASIYYIARWIGFLITGYNMIAVSGIVLSILAFFAIIAIAFTEKETDWKSLFGSMLFCATAYLLFATTVHPWYLTLLIMFSVFTRYKYAIAWSLLIMLTYAAYRTIPYTENLWLVATEYLIVVGWMVYEVLSRRPGHRTPEVPSHLPSR